MFSFRKTSIESIRRFLSHRKNRDVTYSPGGATSSTPPAGFVVDHTRVKLGNGQPVVVAAKSLIQRWEYFQLGIVYGTLPRHVKSGEERFQVEWNRSNDTVWYDILAFSGPNPFLTRLRYPMVRGIRKKFDRDSAVEMQLAIKRLSFGKGGKYQ